MSGDSGKSAPVRCQFIQKRTQPGQAPVRVFDPLFEEQPIALGFQPLGLPREPRPRRERDCRRACVDAGATALVAGTAAFRGGPDAYAANIRGLRGA